VRTSDSSNNTCHPILLLRASDFSPLELLRTSGSKSRTLLENVVPAFEKKSRDALEL